jgi:hypothetical protein
MPVMSYHPNVKQKIEERMSSNDEKNVLIF